MTINSRIAELAVWLGDAFQSYERDYRKITTDADRAPLPTDDATNGYQPGSRWQWGGRSWRATDTTPGAAKWRTEGAPYLTDWASPQAALDWVASVGGELVIPAGTHTLTAPLNLTKLGHLNRRAVLRGEGQSSILQFNGIPGNAIYAGSPAVAGSGLGWDLRDFRVKGQSNTSMTGIFLEYANSARLSRVWFTTMQDAIRMKDTYGVRITECTATQLGRDFLRAETRTFHLIMRDNGAFGIGGYFLNLTGPGANLNIRCEANDVEVCGGLVKTQGTIDGFAWVGNYMEQAAGQMFDFNADVRGEISGSNTFQLSNSQVIDRFLGSMDNNHVVTTQVTWGEDAFPSVGNNAAGVSGSIAPSPKRVPVIGSAYMDQGFYDPVGYYKDHTGRVYLQGNAARNTDVAAPTLPYTLFTLPEGYRPAAPMTFVTTGTTTGTTGPTKIRITAAGGVIIDAITANDLGLGGINFMAGAG